MDLCLDAIWLKSNNMLKCPSWYESLLLFSPVPSGPSGPIGQQHIAGKNKGLLNHEVSPFFLFVRLLPVVVLIYEDHEYVTDAV